MPFNFLWRLNPICCAHQKWKCAIAYRHIDNLSWHSNEKLAITSYLEQDLYFGISTITSLIVKHEKLVRFAQYIVGVKYDIIWKSKKNKKVTISITKTQMQYIRGSLLLMILHKRHYCLMKVQHKSLSTIFLMPFGNDFLLLP